LLPLIYRPALLTIHHGEHSADEPDNRRAPTSTAELPTERDNDAAPALAARPNQEREPAVRHKMSRFKNITQYHKNILIIPRTHQWHHAVFKPYSKCPLYLLYFTYFVNIALVQ